MRQATLLLTIKTQRQGLLDITDRISEWTHAQDIREGLLTQVQLSIPIVGGELALGAWQAIYLFEHRRRPHTRTLALHLIGESAAS